MEITPELAAAELARRRGGAGLDAASAPSAPITREMAAAELERRQGRSVGGFAENVLESGGNLIGDTWSAITSPMETGKAIGTLAADAAAPAMSWLGGARGDEVDPFGPSAKAVGEHYAERYGGLDELGTTLYEDPVGALADVATVLTGGGMAAARAPGVAGQVAKAARTAGAAVDPFTLGAKGVGKVAGGVGSGLAHGFGTTGGSGGAALKEAARTGFEGGTLGELFRGAMRGEIPPKQVVEAARSTLGNMYKARSAQYVESMKGVAADAARDKKILNFDDIDKALDKVSSVQRFEGKDLSPQTAGVRGSISEMIEDWKKEDPTRFHGVMGFDALKKKVGNVRDNLEHGTPQRKVADQAYNAIRATIVKQAPRYAAAMKDYAKASDELDELTKALALGNKSSAYTAMRKLASTMRNDVTSGFAHRGTLLDDMEAAGGAALRPQLAGHALSSWAPRGLSKIGGLGAAGAGGAGAVMMDPATMAAAAAYATISSPRLLGEVAHAGGRVAGQASKVSGKVNPDVARLAALMAAQAGRVPEITGGQ